jgi:hypothetical protein
MMKTDDRPIIIVGCARSGTTLLQAMVHSHARLTMPPENRFVMSVYRRRAAFGDLRDPANTDAVADAVTARRGGKFGDLGLDAEAVRRRMHDVPPTIGSLLGVVLEAYAHRFGKQRWGDKRPNYIQSLDDVLALFPDAQIVHMIRDGRDCVASLKRMPWWTFGYPASVYKWARAIDVGIEARERLRPDQYHEVRYEDLVTAPAEELTSLCTFLGEPFDEAMFQHHRASEDKVPDYKDWHAKVHEPVTRSAVQRWRSELDEQELRLFEHVAGRQLEAVGYERSLGVLRRRPDRHTRLAYRAYATARQRRESADAERAAEVADSYDQPVAAMLTSGQLRIARELGYGHLLDEERSPHDQTSVSTGTAPD